MAEASRTSVQGARARTIDHESFLRHNSFKWLKIAAALSLVALLGYVLIDVKPRPNGGSWYGYTLGTLGAGLIVWLALLGVRKRKMSDGVWSLKAWTSAHVYLGLSLIIIATLHTGFQFGWNVHTLAYTLMMLVILSGIYGIVVYAVLPQTLSRNREEMTQAQMVAGIAAIDRQLAEAAQPLDRIHADAVLSALNDSPFGGSLARRLRHRRNSNPTAIAIALFDRADANEDEARVEALLRRRDAQMDRIRRHLRTKTLLELWLHIHIPLTLALLAALIAHIVSVFYYW